MKNFQLLSPEGTGEQEVPSKRLRDADFGIRLVYSANLSVGLVLASHYSMEVRRSNLIPLFQQSGRTRECLLLFWQQKQPKCLSPFDCQIRGHHQPLQYVIYNTANEASISSRYFLHFQMFISSQVSDSGQRNSVPLSPSQMCTILFILFIHWRVNHHNSVSDINPDEIKISLVCTFITYITYTSSV